MKNLSPLEKAIKYIEDHLNEDIGLTDVSMEIGYSYYHMTRLFASVLGESVGHYINRRRLYRASEKLIYSGQRIIDIAFDSGFESPEGFSRAFKAAFGVSPVDYRKAGIDSVLTAKKELYPEDVAHIANNISHSPEILSLEAMKIAGLRGKTTLSDNQLPGLWNQFIKLHKELLTSSGLGISVCETQQTTYTKNGDVSFSVLIGCPVDSFELLPQMMAFKTLNAGRYAVFTHRGALTNLLKTYQYIYGTWLQSTKEELDDREDFEIYEHDVLSMDDLNSEVKILIPIK